MNFLEWLLDYSSYNRRDFCGEGWETNPNLKYIHFYSDLAIGSCYVVVSLALLYVRRKYSNLLYSDGLSFACFISFLYVLFCGIGHYIDCLFFSYPLYNLKGFWSLVTAGVSVIGAYAIVYALLRHLVKYASDIDASNISSFLLETDSPAMTVSIKGKVMEQNKICKDTLGDLLNDDITFLDLVHPEDHNDLNSVQDLIKGKISAYKTKKRIFSKITQGYIPFQIIVSLITDANNIPVRYTYKFKNDKSTKPK